MATVATTFGGSVSTTQYKGGAYANLVSTGGTASTTLTTAGTFYNLAPTAWTDGITPSGMTTNTTTGVITVTNAGVYRVVLHVGITTTVSPQTFQIAIYKNTSTQLTPLAEAVGCSLPGTNMKTLAATENYYSLAAGDTLQLMVTCTTASGANFQPREISFAVSNI